MNNRILVVDDELIAQRLFSAHLKRLGFEVDIASSAQEAILFLQQGSYALITCDYMMPDMTGLEFLQRVKGNPVWEKTPVVIVSASDVSDELQNALQLGAAGVEKKPVTAAILKRMLENILGVEL